MKIILHGVRGSTAVFSKKNLEYGGNTTCSEISTDCNQIFVDVGTGFVNAPLCQGQRNISIFISHFHHDHIQGLAFNRELALTKKKISISSGMVSGNELRKIILDYFSNVYFPVRFDEAFPNVEFVDFENLKTQLEPEVEVNTLKLNHPGGSSGYSIRTNRSKFVVLLDNEFQIEQCEKLLKFSENASIIVWDGMFTKQELVLKKGWGHSAIEDGQEFIKDLNSGKLLISHHCPFRSDIELKSLEKRYSNDELGFARDDTLIELN